MADTESCVAPYRPMPNIFRWPKHFRVSVTSRLQPQELNKLFLYCCW